MDTESSLLERISEEAVWHLEEVCCRFEQVWQTRQRPDLLDFLNGTSGTERVVLLRELLRLEVFYRRQRGEVPSIEDYRSRFPDDTAVLEQALAGDIKGPSPPAGMHETTDDVHHTGHYPLAPADQLPTGAAPDSTSPASAVGRYRLLRFHAAGGLGEVYVAEDTELHREVALKQIKPEHAAHPASRGRFVLEGEVTGALEHPGVVPIYGQGRYPDGRPFYAMRFIRGETFGEAIRSFHSQAPGQFDSLEFRQLLGRFVAVCHAVAYAHSRGVLHRDIKPANIMLGKFGETLVVDWGLAKVVGSAEGGAGASGTEGPLHLSESGDPATMGAVGTPVYMSPEQAAGKVDELGPATDVYSLGATLYELLTNRAPFEGNVHEVMSQVELGSWIPPRQAYGAVPAALDAICCKALALCPEQRYGSVPELAGDVEHWLADEPVAAYREPWGTRVRRWARKHPRRVTGALVLLVTAVVGLTVGAVLLDRSKREAQASYQMAKKGVNHFLREVSEDVLLDEPGMEVLRQSLLNEALNYHEAFLKIRPNDPEARQQLAETYRLRGELDGELGRMTEGKARVSRAVGLFEGLLRTKPADREFRFGLARSWLALSELQVKSGELESGRETVNRSMELLSALRTEEPARAVFLTLLSRSYDLRATAEIEGGNVEAAVRDNQEAVTSLRRMLYILLNLEKKALTTRTRAGDGPEAWANFRLLARALSNQGMLLKMTGQKAESVKVFQEATALFGWLSEQQPRAGRLRNGHALALLNAGHAQVELGRPVRGEQDFQKALKLLEKLREEDYLIPEYKGSLMRAKGYLGEDLFVRGRTSSAAGPLREAIQLGDELLKGQSSNRILITDHARFLYVLGCLESESGHFEEALRSCAKAGEEQKQALTKAPGDRSLDSDLLQTREAISELRFLKGEIGRDGRILDQRQILRERQVLAGREPLSPQLRSEVGRSAAVLAGLLLEAGRAQEALDVIEQVQAAHEELVRADQARWEQELRRKAELPMPEQIGDRLADTNSQRGLFQPQLVLLDGEPRLLVPPSLEVRRQWAELLARKGAALAATGRFAMAHEVVAQAIALTEEISRGECCYLCSPCSWPSIWSAVAQELHRQNPESRHRYDLACHLALASSLPGTAGIQDPASRAVQVLGDLVSSGFDNPHRLRSDGRLAPLRGRQDFQKLVHELQARTLERSGDPPKR